MRILLDAIVELIKINRVRGRSACLEVNMDAIMLCSTHFLYKEEEAELI